LQAYLLGQSDAEYQHIAKAVSSIIFLATPHRGSNLAELLDSILQVTFHPKQYVTDLKSHSPMLESLNEEFRHVAPELQIFSFYETIETQVNGLPLKKVSTAGIIVCLG
jgi:predicted Ser/Thr protein kinase